MFLLMAVLACGDKGGDDTGDGGADGGTADGGTADGGTDGGGGDGGASFTAPERVGEISGVTAWDVALLDRVALVAADNDGLLIYDLADPSAPVFLASVPVGQATSVSVTGLIAWVGTWSGRLVAVDLTDPALPDWRSDLSLAPHAVGVDARGDTVAVASWSGTTGSDPGWGLTLVDGADPEDPDQLSNLPTPGTALDVRLGDGVAWIADGPHGLQPVDSTSLSAPTLGDPIDVGGDALGVDLSTDAVVVAAGEAGLVLVDPGSHAVLGTLVALDGEAEGVTVEGVQAWVATGTGGLAVVDLSNPADPTLLFEEAVGGTALRVGLSAELGAVAADVGGVVIFER